MDTLPPSAGLHPTGRSAGRPLAAAALVLGLAGLTAWNATRSSALASAQREYARGRLSSAVDHALDHLDRRPWSGAAARIAARALSQLDFPDEAEPYYARAGRLSLGDLQTRARAWVRSDHPERALPLYDAILARAPDDRTALRRSAGVYYALGKHDAMKQAAERLISAPGGAGAGYALRGLANHELGSRTEAARDFERALELDPELKEMPLPRRVFWLDLAEDLVGTGRPADARRHLLRAVGESPDGTFLTMLGRTYQFEGNLDEAERTLRRAVAADPGNDLPLLHLGQLALQKNRLDDAEAYLRRAFALDPRRFETLYNLALVCRRLGRKAEAETWRDQAEARRKAADPDNAARPLPPYAL